jgi:phosphinothricin acetyltransferase
VVDGPEGIAAWLSMSSFYGRPAYRGTVELAVYVDERHRRAGLGSYLLSQALIRAPALGIDTVLGFIFGHNEPSLRLFARWGFARWGELPRVARLDGVERDLVIVGRRIDSADRPWRAPDEPQGWRADVDEVVGQARYVGLPLDAAGIAVAHWISHPAVAFAGPAG